MNFKNKIIAIISTFFSMLSYCQTPIYKIQSCKSVAINYVLEPELSTLKLDSLDSVIQEINEDKSFSAFFKKNSKGSDIYISSLIVIRINKGILDFNKISETSFEPDVLLSNFLEKKFSIWSSNILNSKKNHKIGVYFYYNIEKSLFGIEFVELKSKRYYLISKMNGNLSN